MSPFSPLVIALLIVIGSLGTQSEDFKVDDVISLNGTNFRDSIAAGQWFVEFYAPWCGHCKRLAPIWSEFAAKMKGVVKVAKVDATDSASKGLARQFDIAGYPTIKFFPGDGTVRDYHGERTIPAFETFFKDGYKQVEGKALPLQIPFLDSFIDLMIDVLTPYVGPYEDWLSNHVGTIILSMTLIGLITGFILGRVSVTPKIIRVPIKDENKAKDNTTQRRKEKKT